MSAEPLEISRCEWWKIFLIALPQIDLQQRRIQRRGRFLRASSAQHEGGPQSCEHERNGGDDNGDDPGKIFDVIPCIAVVEKVVLVRGRDLDGGWFGAGVWGWKMMMCRR